MNEKEFIDIMCVHFVWGEDCPVRRTNMPRIVAAIDEETSWLECRIHDFTNHENDNNPLESMLGILSRIIENKRMYDFWIKSFENPQHYVGEDRIRFQKIIEDDENIRQSHDIMKFPRYIVQIIDRIRNYANKLAAFIDKIDEQQSGGIFPYHPYFLRDARQDQPWIHTADELAFEKKVARAYSRLFRIHDDDVLNPRFDDIKQKAQAIYDLRHKENAEKGITLHDEKATAVSDWTKAQQEIFKDEVRKVLTMANTMLSYVTSIYRNYEAYKLPIAKPAA